jgi:hypothetical protein
MQRTIAASVPLYARSLPQFHNTHGRCRSSISRTVAAAVPYHARSLPQFHTTHGRFRSSIPRAVAAALPYYAWTLPHFYTNLSCCRRSISRTFAAAVPYQPCRCCESIKNLGEWIKSIGIVYGTLQKRAFQIVAKSITWARRDTELYCRSNVAIPFRDPGEILICLGIVLNPWNEDKCGAAGVKHFRSMCICAKANLKPNQNFEIIVRHLVLKVLFVLLEDTPSWTYVMSLDNEIRQTVKGILHLRAIVSSGFLYIQKNTEV